MKAVAQFAQARGNIYYGRTRFFFEGFSFLGQMVGELHQTLNLALAVADKLIFCQTAGMDFTEQMANLVVQLQQAAAIRQIGLQAFGKLIQRKFGLRNPGMVRQFRQLGELPFMILALISPLLDQPVLLLKREQILL